MTQLVSQVWPSSFEKACSHIGLFKSNEIHLNLTFILTPLRTSSAKNTPTPLVKQPTTGTSNASGNRPSKHQIDHVPCSVL